MKKYIFPFLLLFTLSFNAQSSSLEKNKEFVLDFFEAMKANYALGQFFKNSQGYEIKKITIKKFKLLYCDESQAKINVVKNNGDCFLLYVKITSNQDKLYITGFRNELKKQITPWYKKQIANCIESSPPPPFN